MLSTTNTIIHTVGHEVSWLAFDCGHDDVGVNFIIYELAVDVNAQGDVSCWLLWLCRFFGSKIRHKISYQSYGCSDDYCDVDCVVPADRVISLYDDQHCYKWCFWSKLKILYQYHGQCCW